MLLRELYRDSPGNEISSTAQSPKSVTNTAKVSPAGSAQSSDDESIM